MRCHFLIFTWKTDWNKKHLPENFCGGDNMRAQNVLAAGEQRRGTNVTVSVLIRKSGFY